MTANDLARVEECLNHLEQADRLTDIAAQSLCPVKGFADEWADHQKSSDAIRALQWQIRCRFNHLREADRRANAALT